MKFIHFQPVFFDKIYKKGLGLPTKKSLMTGFKHGDQVITPDYLEFNGDSQKMARLAKRKLSAGFGLSPIYISYLMHNWNAQIMSITLWETSKMKWATFMKSKTLFMYICNSMVLSAVWKNMHE